MKNDFSEFMNEIDEKMKIYEKALKKKDKVIEKMKQQEGKLSKMNIIEKKVAEDCVSENIGEEEEEKKSEESLEFDLQNLDIQNELLIERKVREKRSTLSSVFSNFDKSKRNSQRSAIAKKGITIS